MALLTYGDCAIKIASKRNASRSTIVELSKISCRVASKARASTVASVAVVRTRLAC